MDNLGNLVVFATALLGVLAVERGELAGEVSPSPIALAWWPRTVPSRVYGWHGAVIWYAPSMGTSPLQPPSAPDPSFQLFVSVSLVWGNILRLSLHRGFPKLAVSRMNSLPTSWHDMIVDMAAQHTVP